MKEAWSRTFSLDLPNLSLISNGLVENTFNYWCTLYLGVPMISEYRIMLNRREEDSEALKLDTFEELLKTGSI